MTMTLTPLSEWGFPISRFFAGAGPCSAETPEQINATAAALADADLSFFRAGLWKPRTRPGCFEGVGEEGLEWLADVRSTYGLKIGTEVATPEHVEACLKYDVDLVWIGARTTPNPFAVQAIADALEGSDVAVLVKNPISPDIDLWVGAIERLYSAGLIKLGGIHRGFSTSNKGEYRFAPHWKVPIEMKRRLPDLPIICDPSHICGRRDLIPAVAQEALDLLLDGLMVEVHVDPDNALSDAKQQFTPNAYVELVDWLVPKHEESSDANQARISELREEVDFIDHELIEFLGRRMSIVRKLADLKRNEEVSAFQPQRWEEIVKSRLKDGLDHGLSEACIFDIFQIIHEEAIQQQESVFHGEEAGE